LQFGLPKSLSQGPHPMPKHAKVDRICNASLQASSAVGTHLWVNQERKGQVLFASEMRCVFRPSVAHDNQFGPQITYLPLDVAQLRNLLAAEQSPEVPYEYENNRFFFPIAPKCNGAAFRIKDLYR